MLFIWLVLAIVLGFFYSSKVMQFLYLSRGSIVPSKKVIIPLPRYGCDPSEVAIPWKMLIGSSIEVLFATPDGKQARADSIMLTGEKLGILKPALKARKDAVSAYRELELISAFAEPLSYREIRSADYDALLLPGGHDKGVIEYLESTELQSLVLDFFNDKKPVAAICHGVLIPARTINPNTGKSVISDFRCTGLLQRQELMAHYLTKWWLGDYYRTYPETTTQKELVSALDDSKFFTTGPLPSMRDSMKHLSRGFCVRDRNYLSARWPGDLYNFSLAFIQMILE